jgi:single-stranded DNA-specific DHH superfamily exonuclease
MIVFHNDVDGFTSALVLKHMLERKGFTISKEYLFPSIHSELKELELSNDRIWFFVDLQPPEFGDHIFCIDHHRVLRGWKTYMPPYFEEQVFIVVPKGDEDTEPTAAVLLTA